MAKDFTGIKAGKAVTDTIAEATAEPAQETHKERKTYTAQEEQEFLMTGQTAGHKGVKLPRINLAFAPDLYDYIKTMSKMTGQTYTEFINKIMREYMDTHAEQYEKAVELRNSL